MSCKNVLSYTVGLPASGKSTFATQLTNALDNYKRINFDLLREMLDGGQWSKENEKFIHAVTRAIARVCKDHGKNIILDNTGFSQTQKTMYKSIAMELGYDEKVVDFTDVPLSLCLDRDEKRGDKAVGRKVILQMYRDYIAPKSKFRQPDGELPYCVICDIDGTIASANGRNAFDEDKYIDDLPRTGIINTVKALCKNENLRLILLSGRKGTVIGQRNTEDWLQKHDINYDALVMREPTDNRSDYLTKRELYEKNIKDKFNVYAIFDDREQVIRQCWDELGFGDRIFRVGRIDCDGF